MVERKHGLGIRSNVPNQDDVINSPIIMIITLLSLARLPARNMSSKS